MGIMEDARYMVAQCWEELGIDKTAIDPRVAEALAQDMAHWIEEAENHERYSAYVRGLVQQIGKAIGREAYVQDDGGVSEDVLYAKVPELVEELINNQARGNEMGNELKVTCSCGASMKVLGDYTSVAHRYREFLAAHEVCRQQPVITVTGQCPPTCEEGGGI